MIKNKIFIFFVLVIIGFTALPPSSFAVLYEEISALELQQRLTDNTDEGYTILDVRPQTAYDQGHIPGSINIPLSNLGYRYIELDRTKDIIVYCALGIQCKIACQILINLGFKDVYNLTGGLLEWTYALETSNGSVNI